MPDLQKIVEHLSKLTVLEAATLVEMLQEAWSGDQPSSYLTGGSAASPHQTITNGKLYHVTTPAPYKQALAAGQVIRVGDVNNPFFAFYEGRRTYPVTLEDKTVVQVPAVKFLKQVRDGAINCPNLTHIAAEVAIHYVMLCRELLMEEIRTREFNGEPPSRQLCLYGCESVDEAKQWRARVGGSGTICELTCTGTIQRADASLLLGDSEPLSDTRDRARRYWRGETSASPEMETLFIGEATVTGFGL